MQISKRSRLPGAAITLAAVMLATGAGHAEQLPKWEAGAGLALISFPDYRGSDQGRSYVFPVPYLVYRGELLQADRGGIRGTLFDSERLTVRLSLNGTLPINSRDNRAREGMADLRPTVELGPTLEYRLWHNGYRGAALDLRAPVRTAITVGSSVRQIGWLFSPNLNLDLKDPPGMPGWNLGLSGGPIFSDRGYNSYFYAVGAVDARAGRPQYAVRGGYAGTQVTLAMSRRFPHHWAGAFVRYDTLNGAVFEDSPLVRKGSAVSAGIALSWIFGQSRVLTETAD